MLTTFSSHPPPPSLSINRSLLRRRKLSVVPIPGQLLTPPKPNSLARAAPQLLPPGRKPPPPVLLALLLLQSLPVRLLQSKSSFPICPQTSMRLRSRLAILFSHSSRMQLLTVFFFGFNRICSTPPSALPGPASFNTTQLASHLASQPSCSPSKATHRRHSIHTTTGLSMAVSFISPQSSPFPLYSGLWSARFDGYQLSSNIPCTMNASSSRPLWPLE